jgi:hypothetical protein
MDFDIFLKIYKTLFPKARAYSFTENYLKDILKTK